MKYVQLDNFNGNLNISCEDGDTLVFNTLLEAQQTLEENCQDGVIIPLNVNIIKVISDCEYFITSILGKEFKSFKNMRPLCNTLNRILDKNK